MKRINYKNFPILLIMIKHLELKADSMIPILSSYKFLEVISLRWYIFGSWNANKLLFMNLRHRLFSHSYKWLGYNLV